MALSTSNLKSIAVQRYFEGIAQVNPAWRRVFNIITRDEASLRISAMSGVPSPGTWDGVADVGDVAIDAPGSANGTSLTYQAYNASVGIGVYDMKDIPEIVGLASRKLGMSVESKRAELAWALPAAINAGTTSITDPAGGAKDFIAADHSTAAATRSNLVTTALDRSSFLVAIRAAREWLNYQDQITDWAMQPKFLLVPAELEATAHQIVGSMHTSSNLQLNTAGMYNTTVVVSPYFTDATDWSLTVDPASGFAAPLNYWQRSEPVFRTIVDQDNWKVRLQVHFADVAAVAPLPDGYYGATVA